MLQSRRTMIIAEAGVNHNGDIDIARLLVDAAAESGADYVKFQTFKAARLVTPSAAKAEYQKLASVEAESQYDMLKRLELDLEMHENLVNHCLRRGIGFLSTGFDIESVELLAGLGLRIFKIPSGEITNLPYLRYIASKCGQVILSTGMANMGEIEAAIDVMEKYGTPRAQITVLHCTTEYPAHLDEVNLLAMGTIRKAFGVAVGYSDHTRGIEIPIAAVALGAVLIEKHFTLDRKLSGPDHGASVEPYELKEMVKSIRHVEMALGTGIKKPCTSETQNISIIRKSIVAKCKIRKGEFFTGENLAVKRPGIGVSPMRWDEFIGKRSCFDYDKDDLIMQQIL